MKREESRGGGNGGSRAGGEAVAAVQSTMLRDTHVRLSGGGRAEPHSSVVGFWQGPEEPATQDPGQPGGHAPTGPGGRAGAGGAAGGGERGGQLDTLPAMKYTTAPPQG